MSSRSLRDRKIAQILNICEDSDNPIENDDDSIADPDYHAENDMDQEQFSNDENEDDQVNIDEIIRSLEDSEPVPSPTSAVLTASQPTQSWKATKTQPAMEEEKSAFK
ncbi:hypothetical protein HHI36_012186 [Cryptolaemus montrouzieri]|uniref:Uncharacterized protein n=1 Tax=Cryptolaemus montrouzieri TaxID=559131 RepID=A0ABD2NDJ2_9CUCU